MPDTGWVLAGTGAASGTGETWSNPGNITNTTDGSTANVTVGKSGKKISRFINATNFSFGLPSGATIAGIEARVRRSVDYANFAGDHTTQLLIAGSPAGSNLANVVVSYPTGTWPTAITNADYGGPTNLWGLTPSHADVSASNFGLAFKVAQVHPSDNGTVVPKVITVWMKIHYSTGNPGAFFAMFSVKDRLRQILKPKRLFWLPGWEF